MTAVLTWLMPKRSPSSRAYQCKRRCACGSRLFVWIWDALRACLHGASNAWDVAGRACGRMGWRAGVRACVRACGRACGRAWELITTLNGDLLLVFTSNLWISKEGLVAYFARCWLTGSKMASAHTGRACSL